MNVEYEVTYITTELYGSNKEEKKVVWYPNKEVAMNAINRRNLTYIKEKDCYQNITEDCSLLITATIRDLNS